MAVIDFSAKTPSAASVKAAGLEGAVRYISPARESWMQGKPANRQQVEEYDREGLAQAFVWQFGGAGNPDALRGRNGGKADAQAANTALESIGKAGYPVFFAVDFDVTLAQWNSVVGEYFRGAIEVLGVERVGIYGHSRAIAWAVEDGLIGKAGDRHLAWQTKSWSNGARAPEAVLYQGTHNVPGPDGVQIDKNEVLAPYWGQGPITKQQETGGGQVAGITPQPGWRGDPTFLPDVLRAFGVKTVEAPSWKEIGHGDFGAIQGVFAHHIGSDRYHWSNIQKHPTLGLCSQIHLSREGVATVVGAGIAWHAGTGSYKNWPTNNANQVAIGIEAESNGTSPWPKEELEAYHRICAAILWFLGKRASTDTLLGHWEYSQQAQGKWDPGAGDGVFGHTLNMDTFRAEVNKIIDAHNNNEEDDDVAFDQITRKFKSRVAGSDFQMRPIDALLNADAHAFVSRANSEKILARLDEIDRKLDAK